MRSKLEIGETKGKLTIEQIIPGESGKHGYVICSCICGGERKIRVDEFRKENQNGCKSCGKGFYFKFENKLFNDYITRCKYKNLEFNLTFEEFKKLINSNCFYCNVLPKLHKHKIGNTIREFKSNGIDRISSDEGYTIKNCLPCCDNCNFAKSNLRFTDFLNHIKRIYDNLKLYNLK